MATAHSKKKKRILITAGPTREHFDPVRFLSNLSTGEMGYLLATVAKNSKKYDVTLISGPTHLKPPPGISFISITSAKELKRECEKEFRQADILVMVAAVCDFTATKLQKNKIHRTRTKALHLKRTPDIVAGLAKKKGKRKVVGFCLETESWLSRAKAKLKRKRLDGIVANYYGKKQVPFGDKKVSMAFIGKNGSVKKLQNCSKLSISKHLLSWIEGFEIQ